MKGYCLSSVSFFANTLTKYINETRFHENLMPEIQIMNKINNLYCSQYDHSQRVLST